MAALIIVIWIIENLMSGKEDKAKVKTSGVEGEAKKTASKPLSPNIISKRNPTTFNKKVSPVIDEKNDLVFVASGNLINVYSL
jgi:uncharacterized protein YbaP (TraB family)